MTPSENIYRSDRNVVDGLDLVDMMEDDQYENTFYDGDDDGQPDMDQEYADLYGNGNEYDWDHGQYDMPEDWSV